MTTISKGDTAYYDGYAFEEQGVTDLNKIRTHNWNSGNKPRSRSIIGDGLELLFENQRVRLMDLIDRSVAIVGCVAWLTDLAILAAMQGKDVCIIVQKEDFLRPDFKADTNFTERLQTAYNKLRGIHRFSLHTEFGVRGEDISEPAIMCAGLANVEKKSAWPRMHDKFLLFRFKDTPAGPDDLRNDNYEYGKQVRFDTVFTGSYNITMNAANSIENSLIITQQPIIDGYYEEFERIFGISEPLDWNSKWVNPRYRIGT